MKLLFIGDIIGKSGIKAIEKHIPKLKEELKLDFIIANVDNVSGGFGLSQKHYNQLLKSGVDVFTGGDHIWDQRDQYESLLQNQHILRPYNYPNSLPGKGFDIFQTYSYDQKREYKILVLHLMGQLFMKHQVDDPFSAAQHIIQKHPLKNKVDAIIIDIHAEASSEKMALGHFVDGKVSAVIGTHTHIPTMDYQILPHGTAYQTDAGMCGDYNSVIGMDAANSIDNFCTKIRRKKLSPALGEASLFATIIDISDDLGLATSINIIQLGNKLIRSL